MNILMLNPPFLYRFSREQRSPAVTKSGTFYYPMWLSYATGVLEESGFNVKLLDAPAEGTELQEILDETRQLKPKLTVVTTSTPSIYNDINVAEAIKDVLPDTYLVMVGPHVSACPEETLEMSASINAIARGEYDYTIRDIARAIASSSDPNRVKGISFQLDGEIFHKEDAAAIKNLDEIPFVTKIYRKHLNYRNYFYSGNRYPIVVFITGRGCPHRCVWCVYPQIFNKRGYRQRSAENIVDEMEYVVNEFPGVQRTGEIMFEDDTLTVNLKRCREMSELILKRGLKVTWSGNSRVQVDLETLKLMKAAGCRSLLVGFESGNQEILDRMKKGITVDESREFMENARKAGILINGAFMIGSPGETKETVMETLNFAMEINPDVAQFYPMMVYPGTEAYDWARENGYLVSTDFKDWITDTGMHNCVVRTPGLSERDLVEYCDYMRRKFYLRPSYILYKLKQAILHPSEGKRTFIAAKRFAKHLIFGTDLDKETEVPDGVKV